MIKMRISSNQTMTRSYLDVEREFRQTVHELNNTHNINPYVSGQALRMANLVDKLHRLANEQRELLRRKKDN